MRAMTATTGRPRNVGGVRNDHQTSPETESVAASPSQSVSRELLLTCEYNAVL